MTTEQINYAIERNELKLNIWGKFSHYGIVLFLLVMPITFIAMFLKNCFEGNPRPFKTGEIIFMIICSTSAYFFYILQRKRLKFKSTETNLSNENFKKIIDDLANQLNWTLINVTKKSIVAKTNPSFWSGSWGEQITLIFNDNKILINSICDPDKRSSVASFGRNKQNTEVIINEINKASR